MMDEQEKSEKKSGKRKEKSKASLLQASSPNVSEGKSHFENLIKKLWVIVRLLYMTLTILGVTGPGFRNRFLHYLPGGMLFQPVDLQC